MIVGYKHMCLIIVGYKHTCLIIVGYKHVFNTCGQRENSKEGLAQPAIL